MLGNLGRHKLNFSLSYTVGWSDYCDFNFLQFSKMYRQREKKENLGNIFLYFIFCLQNGQNCFELVKKKFFGMFLGFRITVQAKFAEALRRVKKQQIKLKFWIWGPITVYYNMTCGQIFVSKKSLHPIIQYICCTVLETNNLRT